MSRSLLCCLLLAGAVSYCMGSLMAIDLGSEFLKVSLVGHGKTPISVVVNEMSKRKTPALVGFVNEERLLGEAAASVIARFPDAIYQRSRDLLGKFANDSTISKMLETHLLPYAITQATSRKTVGFATKDGPVYSAEELVASIFAYAKQITEAQAGGSVVDTVITVPAFYSQFQRQAIIDAAKLADLNVLALINTHAAAALQYGIERDFTNKSDNVLIYDMGSGSTSVALIKYSSFEAKEAGKTKTYSQFEVKDVEWDLEVGALELDNVLLHHFAKEFNAKHSKVPDLLQSPKAVAKLKKAVRRTKEMLSANSAAPCNVEEVHEGIDFASTITREAFESLAGDFFQRAVRPVKNIMERNQLTVDQISAFELLGGGSRVPKLQAVLSEALGGRALDRHLDADEAVVLGAGLFAANLSAQFRLRKFGIMDTTQFGISFQVEELHVVESGDGQAATGPKSARNLLPYMKKLPSKRSVPFTNVTQDPISFTLQYNSSTPHGAPLSVPDAQLGSFSVTGVEEVIKKYNTSGDIRVRFEADYSGILKLLKAEADVVIEVMEEKIIEVEPENVTDSTSAKNDTVDAPTEGAATDSAKDASKDSSEDSSKDATTDASKDSSEESAEPAAAGKADSNATEAGGDKAEKKPAKTVKVIQVPRVKQLKVPLAVGGPGWVIPALAGEDLSAAKARLLALRVKEQVKKENEKAKNELESYIISTREALEADEELQKYALEDARTSFTAQLSEMEDWLYMEGDAETAAEYRKKLAELRKIGDPIYKRQEETELRPAAVEAARTRLDTMAKTANSWPEMKPWIEQSERQPVVDKVAATQQWLESKVKEQEGKPLHEDPVFLLQEVSNKVESIERTFKRVNNKRKPKPPPPPPAADNITANGTAGDATTAEPNVGQTKPDGKDQAKEPTSEGTKDDVVHDEL